MGVIDVVPAHRTLSGKLAETGYELPEGLTFEEWAAEGPTLIAMARSAMWWVGDWLRYGERRFGERYAQAVEATGFALQTLRNAVWVCEKIPPSERRPSLDFGHHEAVAPLEPHQRRELLERAETEGMSVREVREQARRVKDDPAPTLPDEEDEAGDLVGLLDQALAAIDGAIDHHDWHLANRARVRLRAALQLARADVRV